MVAPGAKKAKGKQQEAALLARHEALALVEEQFRDMDVVWAKVHGFPWWPGVLFSGWDSVRAAGIRTDAKLVATLLVPPPVKTPMLDDDTGEETGSFRVRKHCLVMFLDKFNFSVVEIDPRNVASFTLHYELYVHNVMGRKHAKKTDFKRALQQANKLLHMGEEYSDKDLVMLEEPTPLEKKRRMEETSQGMDLQEEGNAALEDAWDDREEGDEAAYEPVEEVDEHKQKPKRTRPQRTRAANKIRANQSSKGGQAKEDATAESSEDVEMETPVKTRRRAPAKDAKTRARKASRKEDYNLAHVAIVSPSESPIDLTDTPEGDQRKPRVDKTSKVLGRPPRSKKKVANGEAIAQPKTKKKTKPHVVEIEDEEEQLPGSNAGAANEEHRNDVVLTPLSSIWTTSIVDGEHSRLVYTQDFVWDDAIFTDELSIAEKKKAAQEQELADLPGTNGGSGRERPWSKRQSRSAQQSQIRQNLMTGVLDPHTMVQCSSYRPKDYVEDPNSRSRGGPTLDPPFRVVVHPDAVFVADLHAHLATCEIIGFLGGKWDESSNTLFIQAAFPCRSLVIDGDDGSTDVEMDPGSEIELRGIIENARLEVVGWYHSHPAFAPDPSVRDIENQTSYQQLFQRPSLSKTDREKPSEPFVGLIVGTYDTRRSSPVSLFRYFHTRSEKVSGGACREIFMPYEFIPVRRHFRSVLEDEERDQTRALPIYPSVVEHFSLSFSKPEQLQLATQEQPKPQRRPPPRSSPVRARNPRKRTQGADRAGDKPAKKPKAKSKSNFAQLPAHVDLSGDGDNKLQQNGQLDTSRSTRLKDMGSIVVDVDMEVESSTEAWAVVDMIEVETAIGSGGVNSNMEVCKLEENCDEDKNGVKTKATATEVEKASACVGNSGRPRETVTSAEGTRGIARSAPSGNTASAAHIVETEVTNAVAKVAEEVVDVVVNSAVLAESPNKRKRSRKNYRPQQIMEHYEVLKLTGNGGQSNASVGSGEGVITQPAYTSASSSSGSSGRKRDRKPRKTMKKTSASPGPSPRRSISPSNEFYHAFHASGPRIPNGSSHEGSPQESSHVSSPRRDAVRDDDMKYIVVEEDAKADVTCNSNAHSGGVHESKAIDAEMAETKASTLRVTASCSNLHDATALPSSGFALADKKLQVEMKIEPLLAKKGAEDDDVDKELRRIVISLVENVVAESVSRVAGSVIGLDRVHGESGVALKHEEQRQTIGGLTNGLVYSSVVENNPTGQCGPDTSMTEKANIKEETSQLFGNNCRSEDIQTSLQKMAVHWDRLKPKQVADETKVDNGVTVTESKTPIVKAPKAQPQVVPKEPLLNQIHPDTRQKRQQAYLVALRTKYGPEMSGCTEQVITLVDYYRDFERRTALNEIWKSRITKLEKIERSLTEYVQFLNMPVALRLDFIQDLIAYLRVSWRVDDCH